MDIKSISEDRNGNIWFGGRYGKLWRYDGEYLKDSVKKKATASRIDGPTSDN